MYKFFGLWGLFLVTNGVYEPRVAQSCDEGSWSATLNRCIECIQFHNITGQENCNCLLKGGCDSCKSNSLEYFRYGVRKCIPKPFTNHQCIDSTISSTQRAIVCTNCLNGRLLSGFCLSIATNPYCTMFDASGICTSCSDGFYLSGAICTRCSPNNPLRCQTCSGGVCTLCKSKFFLTNNECFDCPPQCKSCSSSTACSICDDGYHLLVIFVFYFKADGYTCKSCEQTFPNCNDCTVSACTVCQNGFYLDGSNLCQTCLSIFKHCDAPALPTQCSSNLQSVISNSCQNISWCSLPDCSACFSGAVHLLSGCQSCFASVQNSGIQTCQYFSSCTSPILPGVGALSCNEGYYLKTVTPATECFSDYCYPCSLPNCKTCVNNICTVCIDRFYLKADGSQCLSIPIANCLKTTTANPTFCDICDENKYYFSQNGNCISKFLDRSDETCYSLAGQDVNGACLICQLGYIFDSGTAKCIPCYFTSGTSLNINCGGTQSTISLSTNFGSYEIPTNPDPNQIHPTLFPDKTYFF